MPIDGDLILSRARNNRLYAKTVQRLLDDWRLFNRVLTSLEEHDLLELLRFELCHERRQQRVARLHARLLRVVANRVKTDLESIRLDTNRWVTAEQLTALYVLREKPPQRRRRAGAAS